MKIEWLDYLFHGFGFHSIKMWFRGLVWVRFEQQVKTNVRNPLDLTKREAMANHLVIDQYQGLMSNWFPRYARNLILSYLSLHSGWILWFSGQTMPSFVCHHPINQSCWILVNRDGSISANITLQRLESTITIGISWHWVDILHQWSEKILDWRNITVRSRAICDVLSILFDFLSNLSRNLFYFFNVALPRFLGNYAP